MCKSKRNFTYLDELNQVKQNSRADISDYKLVKILVSQRGTDWVLKHRRDLVRFLTYRERKDLLW